MTSKFHHDMSIKKLNNFLLFSYGRLLMQKGQYALAKSYLVKSHDIFLQVNDAKDPEVIDLLNNLAVVNTHVSWKLKCCRRFFLR